MIKNSQYQIHREDEDPLTQPQTLDSQQSLLCQEHGLNVSSACLDCNFLVLCQACLVSPFHQKHHLRQIGRAGQQAQISINSYMVKLRAKVDLLSCQSERLAIKRLDLFQHRKALLDELSSNSKQLLDIINGRVRAIQHQINRAVDSELQQVQCQIKQKRTLSRQLIGLHQQLQSVQRQESKGLKCVLLYQKMQSLQEVLAKHSQSQNIAFFDLELRLDFPKLKNQVEGWSILKKINQLTNSSSSIFVKTSNTSSSKPKHKLTVQLKEPKRKKQLLKKGVRSMQSSPLRSSKRR